MRDKGLFIALLAMVTVCAFTDSDLSAGAGTAVAEDADEANTAQETAATGVESVEGGSEASNSDENGLQGDSGASDDVSHGGPAGDTE